MNGIQHFALLCGLTVLLGSPLIAADPLPLKVRLDSPADSAVVTIEDGRTVVTVTSATGIGRMTVSPTDRWPKEITLRLRYGKGQPFKTLEGFEATSSRMQIRSTSAEATKTPFFLADEDGKFSRDDVNPTGWLKIDFKPHGDDLDILFPSSLWRDEKQVRFQWIDFYRV